MQEFSGTDRFEVRRRLGRGGFGTVYEVLDRRRGALVALKLLHTADPAALYRFKREFRIIADLAHPNLVALNELFTDRDHWFFTMELVRGVPLIDYLFGHRSWPLATTTSAFTTGTPEASWVGPAGTTSVPPAVDRADDTDLRDVFGQLVAALTAIHRVDVVHRDVKPSNVLVTPEKRVVLLDFGIAATVGQDIRTFSGVIGTPAYMPPEHAFDLTMSPASDVYSVGVMLYEALTGRLPFTGAPMDMMLAKRTAPAIPTDTSAAPELLALAIALLDPDPARRPSGPEILRRLLRGAPRTTERVSPPPKREDRPLIGREPHLSALRAAFAAANAGKSVVVFLPGRSGTGKSALMRRFVERLRDEDHGTVVMQSRCHEREAVPHKAVDGLVDDLAGHLQELTDLEVARLLPRDAPLIATLFPVLLRVPEVDRARARTTTPPDAIELRRRAAGALRELLERVSDRVPLVLTIDDLQWGDVDSASILHELLRLPDSPPFLLIMAYRSEDEQAPLVKRMRESLLPEAAERDVRVIQVDALTRQEAHDLAVRELIARPDVPRGLALDIARESRGNAFFVHELVRHVLSVGGPARLDTVILDRVASLSHDAQQLLIAFALSAQPTPVSVAAAAAGIREDTWDAIRTLSVNHLVRLRERADTLEIEVYHDRIRETVATSLDQTAVRGWNANLAAAWEASGAARPDTLVAHFEGAGDHAKTVRYAIVAAAAAVEALAFDRAAGYYRLLIKVDVPTQQSQWYGQLGDALSLAGRGRDAASAYLAALEGVAPEAAMDLERRAAEQLIRSGYLDEARSVIASLLKKIGVRSPRTEAGAFAGLVARRLALAVRGTAVPERAAHQVSPDALRRIDVLWSIGAPLSLVDLIRGNNLHLRSTALVLRTGEPKRLVRALSSLACASAIAGPRYDGRTTHLLNQAKAIADRIGDPTSTARTVLTEGICRKVTGKWVIARESLERAITQLTPCPGVRWEIETGRTLLHDTLLWMGEWQQLFKEIPARRHEADERGDLYSATHVAVRLAPLAHLAADHPDEARTEAVAGMARWPARNFDLQHRFEVCSLIEVDLYVGRPEDAWRRLNTAWPHLRWTLLAFQNARIEMQFFRARIALARAGRGEMLYLRHATRAAVRLERERAPWAAALASLVKASVRAIRGDRDEALADFDATEQELRKMGMLHYAAAARYRRGQLTGGEQGRELVATATAWLQEQRVVNAERIVGLLAPGRW